MEWTRGCCVHPDMISLNFLQHKSYRLPSSPPNTPLLHSPCTPPNPTARLPSDLLGPGPDHRGRRAPHLALRHAAHSQLHPGVYIYIYVFLAYLLHSLTIRHYLQIPPSLYFNLLHSLIITYLHTPLP